MSHSIHDIKHGGSIHDVKRKKVPLETKAGHFRTWKSGKKWIYGAAVLSLTAGTVAPIGNLAFLPKVEIANAATTSTATLTPGQGTTAGTLPLNTPDVAAAYGATDYTTAANTTLTENVATSYGKTGANWSSGTLTLQNSTAHAVLAVPPVAYDAENSWATFNPTLNMTQAFSFSASFKATPNVVTNPLNNVGNYFGAYFVPVGTTFTQTTSTSQTGSPTYTAISGIANSFFLGRNYYYTGASSLAIQMSQTGASATQNTIGTANTDNTQAIQSGGETVKITWTPTAVGSTTTAGTLTLTFGNNSTISQSVVMQNGMQFGVAGSTGNYGSQMQVWNASFSAYAPTGLVNVKYVDSKGNPINAAPATMLNAKAGDTIGVVAPGATSISDSNTYDYTAPTISGYTYKSVSAAVTASTSATPTITVTYAQQAKIAGSFTFVDGTPGSNTTGALQGNDALNGSGTTAMIAANVGDTLKISQATTLIGTTTARTAATATIQDTTTGTAAVTYTAPVGYWIVGYSYAGGKPVAFTAYNGGASGIAAGSGTVTVASATDTVQFYLAPYNGTTNTPTMTSTGGTTSGPSVTGTAGAQPRIYLATTTATAGSKPTGSNTTAGVLTKLATGSYYNYFSSKGLDPTKIATASSSAYWTAAQGQSYSSLKGYGTTPAGTTAFPTTNSDLNIPGYTIAGVYRTDSTDDIGQTQTSGSTIKTSSTTTVASLANMTFFPTMQAALSDNGANTNDQYFDFPYGTHDYTTTAGSGLPSFMVVYQAIKPTMTLKNLVLPVGQEGWKRADSIVSLTESTGTSTDANMISGRANSSVTGPNYSNTPLSSMPTDTPGIFTVKIDSVQDVNTNAQMDPVTATVTVVGAYGFNTEVSQGSAITGNETNSNYGNDSYASQNDVNVIADNTPWTQGQGLNSGASLSAGTVSNLSAVDPVGNTITPNLQLTDIKADNTGKVTIASGKLNQAGTYTFDVTYTYTNADGTTTVTTTDTITVDPPFALPYTGGEGLAMIGGVSAVAFIAAVALYATKRKKTEEES